LLPYEVALGVGKDIDSLSLMRRADFSRAEYSKRRCKIKAFQVLDDFAESEADVSFDVFKEASNRSYCFDMFSDVWPEVAGVIFSGALSCRAERLAWISSSEDVNSVSKQLCWEGFKVRPNRCRSQETRFHLRNQVGSGEGFDLHISERSSCNPCKLKSSLDASVSAAKADDVFREYGIIHTAHHQSE
jgi:hypothetical protein